jgi:hypothetical protein
MLYPSRIERTPQITTHAGVLTHLPDPLERHPLDPLPLTVQPMLELGRPGDVEAVHESTTQGLDDTLDFPMKQSILQVEDVAVHVSDVDANQLLTCRDQRCVTQCSPDAVQCVSERLATMRLVALRPEQPDQRVTRMEPTRPRQNQERQESKATRLRDERACPSGSMLVLDGGSTKELNTKGRQRR